ncbi:MAG: acyltransferase family protein, partial [Phycicoccus sp.]
MTVLAVLNRPSAKSGPGSTTPPRARVDALDGLRGVAALAVVVFHALMSDRRITEVAAGAPAGSGELAWWLVRTPLRFGWAGKEAVLLFWTLSGLVVTLSLLGMRVRWGPYLLRRMTRLYLPAWGALVLAVGWAVLVVPRWDGSTSWWVYAHAPRADWSAVAADATLLLDPGAVLHPLWSLRWEVAYCAAAPVLTMALVRWWARWPVLVVALVVVAVAGTWAGSVAGLAAGSFVLGALLAVGGDGLHSAMAALGRRRRAGWWRLLLLVEALALIGCPWWTPTSPVLTRPLQMVGCAGLVALVWLWPAAARPFTRPWARWLGARSYSLYLTHLPLIAALALWGAPWWLTATFGTGVA